jgi:hypothetical protein
VRSKKVFVPFVFFLNVGSVRKMKVFLPNSLATYKKQVIGAVNNKTETKEFQFSTERLLKPSSLSHPLSSVCENCSEEIFSRLAKIPENSTADNLYNSMQFGGALKACENVKPSKTPHLTAVTGSTAAAELVAIPQRSCSVMSVPLEFVHLPSPLLALKNLSGLLSGNDRFDHIVDIFNVQAISRNRSTVGFDLKLRQTGSRLCLDIFRAWFFLCKNAFGFSDASCFNRFVTPRTQLSGKRLTNKTFVVNN